MKGAHDAEVTPVERCQPCLAQPLARGENRRVNDTECEVRVLLDELIDSRPIARLNRVDA